MRRKDSPMHPNAQVSHAENRFDAARLNLDGETLADIRATVIAARAALTAYDTTPNDRPFSKPQEIKNLGLFRDRVTIAEAYVRIREHNDALSSADPPLS